MNKDTFTVAMALVLAPALAPPASAARRPLDLIVAVDTSGSMDEEVARVRAGLNDLAVYLDQQGHDLHVILIADPAGLCVPAPLGSGACPADEKLPGYRHVAATVSSNDALQQVIAQHGQYAASLRAGSRRAILVVSDDDSDLGASAFRTQLSAPDAGFATFTFLAIASSADPFCFPGNENVCCPNGMPVAAAEGVVYKQLVAQTTGGFYDLCLQDFIPAWPQLARVIAIFLDGFEGP
jgi:hypothetical protein